LELFVYLEFRAVSDAKLVDRDYRVRVNTQPAPAAAAWRVLNEHLSDEDKAAANSSDRRAVANHRF
jgi:hypothetical protein